MSRLLQDDTAPARLPILDLAALLTGSRLGLLIAGLMGVGLLASGLAVQKGNLVYHAPVPVALDIWARWDAEWYLLIAGEGYDAGDFASRLPARHGREAAAGFFPLYPALIRVASPLLGGVGAGVLISNLCLAVSLCLLFRLTAMECRSGSPRRAGLAACGALMAFPMSFFLSAVYSEALFLMLSLIVFDRVRRGRFATAGLAAFFAALSRPGGILLVIPLLWEWWTRRREGTHKWGWLAALAPPAGLGVFMIVCDRVFSDPLAFAHRQERWRGPMSGPWRAFVRWWQETPALHGAHDSTLELVLAVIVLALLPIVFRRLSPGYSLYATAVVLLPLCTTIWSFGRIAMAAFPLFMAVGMIDSPWGRRLMVMYAFVGGTISGVLMALFASWWWAG